MGKIIFLNNKNKWHILFVIMIVLIVAINVIWIKRNKTAPAGNGLTDLFPAINFYLDIAQKNTPVHVLFASPMSFVNLGHFFKTLGEYIRFSFFIYPPLAPISYSLTYFIFGFQSRLELTINIVYIILALWAIYKIGTAMFNQRAGLLAAFVFSSFPGVIVKTRHICAEFMLMCLAPVVFLFLLKTDAFRNRKYSILFGISLGVMALAKWEFPLTVLAPFTFYLFYSSFLLKRRDVNFFGMAIPLAHLSLSLFIATIIALPWYGVGLQDVYWRIFIYDQDKIAVLNNIAISWEWFIDKISYYLLAVANGGIHFFYFCILILSILFVVLSLFDKRSFLERRKQIFCVVFLCLWIIIPYLLVSFMALRNLSHALVILPAIALFIGVGILSCSNRCFRIALISLVLVYGICVHARSLVTIKPLDFVNSIRLKITPKCNLGLEIIDLTHPLVFAFEGKRLYMPDERDWKAKEVITFIQQDSRNLGHKPLVYFLGLPIEEFTGFSLQYYNLLSGFTFYLEPRGNDKSQYPPDRSRFDYVAIVSDKMITEEILDERLFVVSYNVDHKNHKTRQFREEFFHKFSFIRDFLLPNGLRIYMYRRILD